MSNHGFEWRSDFGLSILKHLIAHKQMANLSFSFPFFLLSLKTLPDGKKESDKGG